MLLKIGSFLRRQIIPTILSPINYSQQLLNSAIAKSEDLAIKRIKSQEPLYSSLEPIFFTENSGRYFIPYFPPPPLQKNIPEFKMVNQLLSILYFELKSFKRKKSSKSGGSVSQRVQLFSTSKGGLCRSGFKTTPSKKRRFQQYST